MPSQISPFLFNATQMVGMGNVDANLRAQEQVILPKKMYFLVTEIFRILGAVEDERDQLRNAKTGEIEKKVNFHLQP